MKMPDNGEKLFSGVISLLSLVFFFFKVICGVSLLHLTGDR